MHLDLLRASAGCLAVPWAMGACVLGLNFVEIVAEDVSRWLGVKGTRERPRAERTENMGTAFLLVGGFSILLSAFLLGFRFLVWLYYAQWAPPVFLHEVWTYGGAPLEAWVIAPQSWKGLHTIATAVLQQSAEQGLVWQGVVAMVAGHLAYKVGSTDRMNAITTSRGTRR